MASNQSKKAPRIKTHPLIAKLVKDPDNLPRLVGIPGYIGPSPEKNHVRIYNDLDFSSYTEVPKEAIQHVEPFDDTRENSATVALVSADAPVRFVRRNLRPDESRFLAGGLAATQLQGTAARSDATTACCPATLQQTEQCGGGGEPGSPPPSVSCPPPSINCPPPSVNCGDITDTCCCPSTLTTTTGY